MIKVALAILVVWLVYKYFSSLLKLVLVVLLAWLGYTCFFGTVSLGTSLVNQTEQSVKAHLGSGVKAGSDSALDIKVDGSGLDKVLKDKAGEVVDSLNVADMVPHNL